MSTDKQGSERKKLGKAIRFARKGVGLSQKEFAEKLLVSDKTVSAYEVGRAMPGFDVLRKMTKIVNKPLSYFDNDTDAEDLDLHIKLHTIERELLEIKKLLKRKH